jgi:hypothetical protein
VQPRLVFYLLHRQCQPAWGALPWELATAAVGPQAVAVVEGARSQLPRAAAVQQAWGLERPQVLEPLQALVNLL